MKSILAAALVLAAALPVLAEDKPAAGEVDVVFCIDRSGSMQEVIDTAKRKIWAIVNDIAKVRPTPVLRIGLIGYGSANTEFRFFDLTDDLDGVYANLMTFRTDMGGDEWVGAVVQKATKDMKWSKNKEALRMIFVVGNETALQGTEELMYTRTVPEAIKADIVVNAIYCGKPSADEERTWREVGKLADGSYTVIDLSGGAVSVATPMDEELAKLNAELNKTYIPFGRRGAEGKEKQRAQDAAAEEAGGAGVVADRTAAKSAGVYNNSGWDLVDALKQEGFKLEDVKDEDLPEDMRKMTLEEKKARIEAMRAEREKVQKAVAAKAIERQKYIDKEIAEKGLTQDKAFDEAVRRMVREQAAKKGFEVEKE